MLIPDDTSVFAALEREIRTVKGHLVHLAAVMRLSRRLKMEFEHCTNVTSLLKLREADGSCAKDVGTYYGWYFAQAEALYDKSEALFMSEVRQSKDVSILYARMVEQADTGASNTPAERCEGSTPSSGTKTLTTLEWHEDGRLIVHTASDMVNAGWVRGFGYII